MVDLVDDNSGGQPASMTSEEAREALLSGRLTLPPGEKINIYDSGTKKTYAAPLDVAKTVLTDPTFQIEDEFLKAVRLRSKAAIADTGPFSEFAKSFGNQLAGGVPSLVKDYKEQEGIDQAIQAGKQDEAFDLAVEAEVRKRVDEAYPISGYAGGISGAITGGLGLNKALGLAVKGAARATGTVGVEVAGIGVLKDASARVFVQNGAKLAAIYGAEGALASAPSASVHAYYGNEEAALTEVLVGSALNLGIRGAIEVPTGLSRKAKEAVPGALARMSEQADSFTAKMAEVSELRQGVDDLASQATSLNTELQTLRARSRQMKDDIASGKIAATEDVSAQLEQRASILEQEISKINAERVGVEAKLSEAVGNPTKVFSDMNLPKSFTDEISEQAIDAKRQAADAGLEISGEEALQGRLRRLAEVYQKYGLNNKDVDWLTKWNVVDDAVKSTGEQIDRAVTAISDIVPEGAATTEALVLRAKSAGLSDIDAEFVQKRLLLGAGAETRARALTLHKPGSNERFLLESGQWDKYVESIYSMKNQLRRKSILGKLSADSANPVAIKQTMTTLQSDPRFNVLGSASDQVQFRRAVMALRAAVNNDFKLRASYGISLASAADAAPDMAKRLPAFKQALNIEALNTEYSALRLVSAPLESFETMAVGQLRNLEKLAERLAVKGQTKEQALKAMQQRAEVIYSKVAAAKQRLAAAVTARNAAEVDSIIGGLNQYIDRVANGGVHIERELLSVERALAKVSRPELRKPLEIQKALLVRELEAAKRLTPEDILALQDSTNASVVTMALGGGGPGSYLEKMMDSLTGKGGTLNGFYNFFMGARRLTTARANTSPSVNIGLMARGAAQISKQLASGGVGLVVKGGKAGVETAADILSRFNGRIARIVKEFNSGKLSPRLALVSQTARQLGSTDEELQMSIDLVAEQASISLVESPDGTAKASGLFDDLRAIASEPSYGEVAFKVKRNRIAALLDPEVFVERLLLGLSLEQDVQLFQQHYPKTFEVVVAELMKMPNDPKTIEAKKRLGTIFPGMRQIVNTAMIQQQYVPVEPPSAPGGAYNKAKAASGAAGRTASGFGYLEDSAVPTN